MGFMRPAGRVVRWRTPVVSVMREVREGEGDIG